MTGTSIAPELKSGISRVWRGRPDSGQGDFAGTAFPVGGTLFLTAAHVAARLIVSAGNPEGYLTGGSFSRPQPVLSVIIPKEWQVKRAEFDCALLEVGGPPVSNAAVVPLLTSREGWTSNELPSWLMGFGSDPEMSLSSVATSFQANYPPHRTLVFNGHVDTGMSGGPVLTIRGACGVIRGRIPEAGQIEVVPAANMEHFLAESGISTVPWTVPAYPSTAWSESEKAAWVRSFPPGPPVQELVRRRYATMFANGYDGQLADLLRIEANRIRLKAEPNLIIEGGQIYKLGNPDKDMTDYFVRMLQVAGGLGPRMLASVIVCAESAILEGNRGALKELIDELYAKWDQYRSL